MKGRAMPTTSNLPAVPAGSSTVTEDRGFTTTEMLMWAAVTTITIVAIGGLLQALGVDVMNWVRTKLLG
jgi:Tfp pilus assembly protein FimT